MNKYKNPRLKHVKRIKKIVIKRGKYMVDDIRKLVEFDDFEKKAQPSYRSIK